MLKFKKINEENNTPFDTSILDGISDPVLIVEHGETAEVFENPIDERTADYVLGRIG